MCGRFGLTRPERLDLKRFGIREVLPLAARYNITPGSDVLAVRERDGAREATMLHWGLVPWWAKDATIGSRMANARADTAFEKPSFRDAMRERRCLIPADVFYEWQDIPGQRRRQPYAIRMRDEGIFGLGGLWEYWKPREGQAGEPIVSCTVLTTNPNPLLEGIHDRMPVIIPPERYRSWLDPRTSSAAVKDMLHPTESELMEAWPISLRVNNPREDGPELLEVLKTADQGEWRLEFRE